MYDKSCQWLNDDVTKNEISFRFAIDYVTLLTAVQSSIRWEINKYNFHITQLVTGDEFKNFKITSLNIPIDPSISGKVGLNGYYDIKTAGSFLIALMVP